MTELCESVNLDPGFRQGDAEEGVTDPLRKLRNSKQAAGRH